MFKWTNTLIVNSNLDSSGKAKWSAQPEDTGSGVIIGYTARVNPQYLNYHIKAFINLEVEPLQKPVFYPFIEKIPNVVECNCVTGDYSMLIETLFETTAQLDHFINELQQFGRTKTQIVFSTSVEQREVPIETKDE
jgi:Lrp/AsnC family leucine-responsive transcriptional regulator